MIYLFEDKIVQTIPKILTKLVYEAVVRAELTDVLDDFPDVRATKNPKFGDFQSNHAFDIGRKIRKNPREIAKMVMEQVPDHEAIQKIDIAGPGFLNFHLHDAWLAKKLKAQIRDANRGIVQSGAGKRLLSIIPHPISQRECTSVICDQPSLGML